jgi:hypothetical protein
MPEEVHEGESAKGVTTATPAEELMMAPKAEAEGPAATPGVEPTPAEPDADVRMFAQAPETAEAVSTEVGAAEGVPAEEPSAPPETVASPEAIASKEMVGAEEAEPSPMAAVAEETAADEGVLWSLSPSRTAWRVAEVTLGVTLVGLVIAVFWLRRH